MTSTPSYLRYPTVQGEVVAFVAEDEVWAASLDGGRAWPVTADRAPVGFTRLSPDGRRVAFTSRREGAPEVHVADLDGAGARRLTFWGDEVTRVLGWLDDAHVVAATPAGQMSRWATWAWAVPVDGGPARRLPLGPVSGWTADPDGAVVVATDGNRRGAAAWKRYRGGTIGRLWLDPDGEGRFAPFLGEVDGQLEDPVWTGGRLAFLSDHEGWGNVYSVAADGSDLRRHSDHADRYARALAGDGTRLVHAAHGELYVLDDLAPDAEPRRLPVTLPGARPGRRPAVVAADDALGEVAVDRTGRAAAVEVRGTLHWLTSRDGPVRAVADTPGVRVRLPRIVPTPAERADGAPDHDQPWVLRVSDADGDDALELGPADGTSAPRRLAGGTLGRVLDLAASPDGRRAAVASHDGRVLLLDLTDGAAGEPVVVADGLETDASGLVFSPDSRWLAWLQPGGYPLRQIRLAELGDAGSDGPVRVVDATPLRFIDTEPVFTDDGLHLAFLSVRTFDPVYDALSFDMAFVAAQRPFLLPLAASTPSPLAPSVAGRPVDGATGGPTGGPTGAGAAPDAAPGDAAAGPGDVPRVVVDVAGLTARAVPLPVPAGRYEGLHAAGRGLLWREPPLAGELGETRSAPEDEAKAPLRRFDLDTRRTQTLVEAVTGAWPSGDGRRVLVRDGDGLRLLPTDRVVPAEDPDGAVAVDLGRVQVVVDPAASWQQMFDEQGRLMRDHFWVPDMAGVDWDEVLRRYRPLVDRVASRDDLSEVLWETVGELGCSHSYETPPPRPVEAALRLGHLGADLARDDDGTWRVRRILPGEPSVAKARSPLLAPGAGVEVGDALLAVDGRAVDPVTGPGPLLVGTANRATELTVAPADGGPARRVAVVPLADERPVRYHDWVAARRQAVHAATGGRVGYLHVPDMVASGWAQLHRDLHTEVRRDALVLDLRGNAGGHLSELVLEKLSRRLRARTISRHAQEETWPSDAPRGPLVCVSNQWAGSDGDIGTAMFRALGLGPVVGTRTWGGVVGIDGRYTLADGTAVTQPRYGFWMEREGWGVENYGVDPDVEVLHPPQAWAADEDPQLDTAVSLVLGALEQHQPLPVPDWRTRPDRAAPVLPPRP
ncbi:PDZ domain-containing protein [Jannaschia sp. R86511]|uniref:S41 family peptidase n=1 Tax=Jannaschia sp. R86511 TaxID=3093853 RepID=UPI0036D40EF7